MSQHINSDTCKILLIIDKYTHRSAMVEYLRKEGYAVSSCTTAKEGLRAVSESYFHLLVIDEDIPGQRYDELARDAAEVSFNQKISLTLLSTSAGSLLTKGLLGSGFDAVLRKPVNQDDIAGTIPFVLSRNKRMQSIRYETLLEYFEKESDFYQQGPAVHFKLVWGNAPSVRSVSNNVLQWGYQSKEFLGSAGDLLNLVTIDEQTKVKKVVKELLKTNGSKVLPVKLLKKNRETFSAICYLEVAGLSQLNGKILHGYVIEELNLENEDSGSEQSTLLVHLEESLASVSSPFHKYSSDFGYPFICESKIVYDTVVEAVANLENNLSILITGDTGTGKTYLAECIHMARGLKSGDLVDLRRVQEDRWGVLTDQVKIETSTLIIESIESLSEQQQIKILEYLNSYERTPASCPKVISTSVYNLQQLLELSHLNPELLFRLNNISLHLPVLNERKEDIPLLINCFFKDAMKELHLPVVSQTFIDALRVYSFPGNIRELKSIVRGVVNLADGEVITSKQLPSFIKQQNDNNLEQKLPEAIDGLLSFSKENIPTAAAVERNLIEMVYRMSKENKSLTARRLGISLRTLQRKMKMYEQGEEA